MIIDQELCQRIIAKKKELDSLRPFPKAALQRLKKQFDVLLIYNSNAIEGNTLNLGETRLVIEEGMTIGGKPLKDHFEAINHKKAIDCIEAAVKNRSISDIDQKFLCKLNRLILNDIEDEEIGIYRLRKVQVAGASFIPAKPELIAKLMKEFFKWLNSEYPRYNKRNNRNYNLIEFSAIAHEKLTLIHPFIDGNGRIARLFTNILFMKNGYPPILILKTERKKYLSTLDKAHQLSYKPFIDFIGRCMERSLSMYLDALKIPREDEEYASLSAATKFCNYSQEYLSLLARKGKLHAIKTGRNWLTTKKAVEEYVKNHSNT